MNVAEDFTAFGGLIPEDAVPIAGWRIALYMTPDGAERCNWDEAGEVPIHILLGCINWALADWIAQERAGLDDEEDD